jgi:hypothetical protein
VGPSTTWVPQVEIRLWLPVVFFEATR